MKPTFSPESTARLKQAYELLERVYRDESHTEPGVAMNWLSEASGKVHFVMQSTSKYALDDVRLIVLDEVAR